MKKTTFNVGDKVSYWDMANQDGKIWEIMTTPEDNTDPKWGWTSGFGLMSHDTGETTFSDLRQCGWRYADNYGPVK